VKVTIAEDALGRSIKSVVTGGRRYAVHEMQSIKSGHLQSAENDGQFALARASEVQTDIADYLLHPHRVDLDTGSTTLSYIPTMARHGENGTVEIIEMTGRFSRQHYSEAARHEALREYKARGWLYEKIDHDVACRLTTKNSNIAAIYYGRRTAFTSRDHLRLTEHLLAAGGVAPLADAANAIGCRIRGELVIFAMMVRRMANIDLDHPLTPSSAVKLHNPSMPKSPGFRLSALCSLS
jgi:hypothetical protein